MWNCGLHWSNGQPCCPVIGRLYKFRRGWRPGWIMISWNMKRWFTIWCGSVEIYFKWCWDRKLVLAMWTYLQKKLTWLLHNLAVAPSGCALTYHMVFSPPLYPTLNKAMNKLYYHSLVSHTWCVNKSNTTVTLSILFSLFCIIQSDNANRHLND